MTIPDEAVQAMPERIYAKTHGASTDVISGQRGLIGGWNEHKRDGQTEFVRADLAAPFLQGLKVKALEWKPFPDDATVMFDGSTKKRYVSRAVNPFTAYFILTDGSRYYLREGMSAREESSHSCFEAADAKAQADYEARFWSMAEVSALKPSPAPAKRDYIECECTKIQQDEHCIVGYPSLLCEICDGKGVVPSPRAQALEVTDEMLNAGQERLCQLSASTNFNDYEQAEIFKAMFEASGFSALSSQPVADGWLPIETAPKDGTVIQAWHKVHKCPVSVLWKDDGFPYKGERLNWYERSYTTAWPENAFTHWRPLPASPGASE